MLASFVLIVRLALAPPAAGETPPVFAPPAVQEQRLIYRAPPLYPKPARDARVEGAVKLAVWIGEDGIVKKMRLIGGHPLLVPGAFEAVARWRYRPLVRNGRPVAVVTTVEVRFSLGRRPPSPLMVASPRPGDFAPVGAVKARLFRSVRTASARIRG
jgi:TonB family protein